MTDRKFRCSLPTLVLGGTLLATPAFAVGFDQTHALLTFTQELSKVDRAILDGETEGFVRVHVRKGADEIVGATVVAAHAGDLISELTLAMNGNLGQSLRLDNITRDLLNSGALDPAAPPAGYAS